MQSDSDTTDTDTDNPDDYLPVWHPKLPKTVDLYYLKRKKRKQNEVSTTAMKSNSVQPKVESTLPKRITKTDLPLRKKQHCLLQKRITKRQVYMLICKILYLNS